MAEFTDNEDGLIVEGLYSEGYGIIGKKAMRDKRLTRDAKTIYAYFRSFAGAGSQAFPKVETIMADLDFNDSKTFYFHMNHLKGYGYVKVIKKAMRNANGDCYERNMYILPDILVEDKVFLDKIEEYKRKVKEKNDKKKNKKAATTEEKKDESPNKEDVGSDNPPVDKPKVDKPIGDNPVMVYPESDNSTEDNSPEDNSEVDNPPSSNINTSGNSNISVNNNNSFDSNSSIKSNSSFNNISQSSQSVNNTPEEEIKIQKTDRQTDYKQSAKSHEEEQEELEVREFNAILETCQLWEFGDQVEHTFEGIIERMFFQKVKIGESTLPKTVVRNKLRKLNPEIIVSALSKLQWNFNNGTEKVSHSTNYIITVLYNEIHEYYSDVISNPEINRMERQHLLDDAKKSFE